ncbi:MAG: dephospho-CoA kinase [Anaerolineae bacterium]
MYTIGLTGSIASGKSTVAGMLGRLGAEVFDADAIAHSVMQPGSAVYLSVIARFGRGILALDGTINRIALGGIVFTDAEALADLERLVHPAVITQILGSLQASKRPIAVVEAIKLLEAQMQYHCDAIWVVSCARAQQVERLRTRNLNDSQIEQRLSAQPPLWQKLVAAHVVIDNSGSLEMSQQQVQAAWRRIQLASMVVELWQR